MSALTIEQQQFIQAHIDSRDGEIQRQMATIQSQGHELAQLKAYLQQQHATAQAAATATQPATTAEPPAYLAMLDRLTSGHENLVANTTQFQSSVHGLAGVLSEGLRSLGDAHVASLSAQTSRPPMGTFSVDLPRYNGLGDFDRWHSRLLRILKAKNLHTTEAGLHWAITTLDDSALQYVEIHEAELLGLDHLFTLLRDRFVPKNEGFRLMNQLSRLRQNHEDFETYLREFNYLLPKIGSSNLTDETAKWMFLKGLPSHVQQECLYYEVTTLHEAQDIARQYHYAHAQTPAGRSYAPSTSTDMQVDHLRHATSSRGRDRDPRGSGRGRGRGYRQGRAPSRPHSRRSTTSVHFMQSPRGYAKSPGRSASPRSSSVHSQIPAKSTCSNCGLKGHWRRDCHKLAVNAPRHHHYAPRKPSHGSQSPRPKGRGAR